ncbi:MAG: nucleotidyltransferase domain-containing protein [Myxococcaceae bacterium]
MTPEILDALTGDQRAVASRVLAEEESRRRHVVVSLSGAHAYGFPSPDSDLDVKAVHLDPTPSLLGFPRQPRSAERLETIDGVEIDYSSNELGVVLQGVLKGNGNYLERFLSGYVMVSTPMLVALQPLVRRAISRRVHRHYAGFATQQRLEWEKTGRRSAKKLLYVLRTTLTGTHLLQTGEMVTDATRLLARYGFAEAQELIDQKKRGEKSELPEAFADKWATRIPEAFALLDRSREGSALPQEPPNEDELESWLIAQRLEALGQR